jgi:hypothetical protein
MGLPRSRCEEDSQQWHPSCCISTYCEWGVSWFGVYRGLVVLFLDLFSSLSFLFELVIRCCELWDEWLLVLFCGSGIRVEHHRFYYSTRYWYQYQYQVQYFLKVPARDCITEIVPRLKSKSIFKLRPLPKVGWTFLLALWALAMSGFDLDHQTGKLSRK